MSGILNARQRIIDVIVTDEGRRQLASGKMRIEFATFTDGATYYAADTVSGSEDASKRLFLEPCVLPCDQITFESNEYGRLQPFRNSDTINSLDGFIVSGSTVVTSSAHTFATRLVASSIDSLRMMQPICIEDQFFNDNSFEISDEAVVFTITDNGPIAEGALAAAQDPIPSIERLESLFNDKRLVNSTQFMFLPPINRSGRQLGQYANIKTNDKAFVEQQLLERMHALDLTGFCKEVSFVESSRENNVMAQFFEIENACVSKLDVIDFGMIHDDMANVTLRLFFVGRVFVDGNNLPTYVNLFTIALE